MNSGNFLAWLFLFSFFLPVGVWGQYVKQETIGSTTYAVIYADGLAESAIWPIGMKLTRQSADGKVTVIRHQVDKGNGGNLSVNDRVAARFIIAPTDFSNFNIRWEFASGVEISGNENLDADFTNLADRGCRTYSFGGRKWRVPTQRELQLMWVLREGIRRAYSGVAGAVDMVSSTTGPGGNYWSATEESATKAWVFDFSSVYPRSFTQSKSSAGTRVRCVSDY